MTVIDENLFATGDDDGTVKREDIPNFLTINSLTYSICLSTVWDLRRKGDAPVFSLKEMEDYVSAMVTTDEKKYLACASGDGSLTTLNMSARKMHVQVYVRTTFVN